MPSPEFTPLFTCTDAISCLSLSNNYLALGSDNGTVSLVCLNSISSSKTLTHHTSPCNALAFSDANSDILYSAHGGSVSAWDLRNPVTPIFDLEVSEDEVNSIDVNVQDECIAAADDLGSVTLISTAAQKVTRVFQNHANICSTVKFRPSWPNQLISAGLDCQLVVRDWKAGGRSNRKCFSMTNLIDPRRFASLLISNDGSCGRQGRNVVAPVRIASSFSPEETQQMITTRALGQDLPLNPPMIHSIACSASGDYVFAGLGNGTVEIFHGGKYIRHSESLIGHKRCVAAILPIGESHIVSGGDDCNLFLWVIARGGSGIRFAHLEKISALAGRDLSQVYVADNTSTVKVVDLGRA
ncbi:hypothetical protein Aperf_G00000055569 [Anoplocephala perfoliata]